MEFSKENLKTIANSQRILCLCILADILLLFVGPMFLPQMILVAANLVISIFVIINIWKLSQALGESTTVSVIVCILMLIPIIGLILLLFRNARATKVLRQAGLNVGLLGVSQADIDKL